MHDVFLTNAFANDVVPKSLAALAGVVVLGVPLAERTPNVAAVAS